MALEAMALEEIDGQQQQSPVDAAISILKDLREFQRAGGKQALRETLRVACREACQAALQQAAGCPDFSLVEDHLKDRGVIHKPGKKRKAKKSPATPTAVYHFPTSEQTKGDVGDEHDH
jgi:hypothetical protein